MEHLLKPLLLLVALVTCNAGVYGQGAAGLPIVISLDELLDKAGGIRYLDTHQATLPSAAGTGYYGVLQRLDSASLNWHLGRYTVPTNRLVLEQFFVGVVPQQLEGRSREWYTSGQLQEKVLYHKNRVVDTLRTYYPSGKLRRVQTNRKSTTTCYDSLGNLLRKCPLYHTFATLKGKNTYSGRFLNVVQQHYPQFLPAGYPAPKGQLVYYAFRIDPTGLVQEPRILSAVAPELQAAILEMIKQLPAFEPAFYEGQATDDVVDGFVRVN
jgi:protein TonB